MSNDVQEIADALNVKLSSFHGRYISSYATELSDNKELSDTERREMITERMLALFEVSFPQEEEPFLPCPGDYSKDELASQTTAAIGVCMPREVADFADRAFVMLAAVLPQRLVEEEVGDALEMMTRLNQRGASPRILRAKVIATCVWCALNGVREFMSALLGKTSSSKK